MPHPRALLKPRKARPFFGRHPWVLASAVERVEGSPADGDVVDLATDKGKFIARGVFNSQSRIRVRLYSWRLDEELDEPFWRRRIEEALRLRATLGYDDPQGAARLVNSEGDLLSGLIVDRYGPYLAVQTTAAAMAARIEMLVRILVDVARPRGIVLRTERGTVQAEGPTLRDGPLWGEMPSEPVVIHEHGVRYLIDLAEGQKTGFYLDQRENRRVAAGLMRGRKVLDMFCYSGGFALAAAAAGAAEVLGIDTSAKAVELARQNAEVNGLTNVWFKPGDCFPAMEGLLAEGQRFGGVVLDPPKFARGRRGVDEALRAYHWLNRLGVELCEPGGVLVTCSCSGSVTREDFSDMLLGVAQQTGRDVQVLEQRGPAPDHPVTVTCREGEYLKCFVCRVG